MKNLIILISAIFSFARGDIGYGTLHTIVIGHSDIQGGLQVSNNNIVVREHSAIFSFDEEKLIGNFRSTKFLNVGINGSLIMTLKPDFRFKFSEKRAPNKTRQLLYDGDEVFELCTDQSIRHKSNCSGAKKVSILYTDFDDYWITEPSD